MNVGFGLSLIGGLWALAAPMAPPREENQTKNQQWNQWRKKATHNEWSEMKTATSQSINGINLFDEMFDGVACCWRNERNGGAPRPSGSEMKEKTESFWLNGAVCCFLFFSSLSSLPFLSHQQRKIGRCWLKRWKDKLRMKLSWLWAGGSSAAIEFHSINFTINSISSMLAIQNQMKRRKDSLVGVDKEKVNWLRKEKVEWVDGQRKTHNQSLRHLLKAIEQPSNPSINFHFLNQQKENLTFLFWFRQFNYDWSGGNEKRIF